MFSSCVKSNETSSIQDILPAQTGAVASSHGWLDILICFADFGHWQQHLLQFRRGFCASKNYDNVNERDSA